LVPRVLTPCPSMSCVLHCGPTPRAMFPTFYLAPLHPLQNISLWQRTEYICSLTYLHLPGPSTQIPEATIKKSSPRLGLVICVQLCSRPGHLAAAFFLKRLPPPPPLLPPLQMLEHARSLGGLNPQQQLQRPQERDRSSSLYQRVISSSYASAACHFLVLVTSFLQTQQTLLQSRCVLNSELPTGRCFCIRMAPARCFPFPFLSLFDQISVFIFIFRPTLVCRILLPFHPCSNFRMSFRCSSCPTRVPAPSFCRG
jgi:hypothetical protein